MPWKRGSDAVEAWVGCRTLWVGCRGSVGRMPYPENPNFRGLHIAGSRQKPPIGAVRRPPNDMPGKIWSRARQNGLRMLPERGSDAVLCGPDAVEARVGCRI